MGGVWLLRLISTFGTRFKGRRQSGQLGPCGPVGGSDQRWLFREHNVTVSLSPKQSNTRRREENRLLRKQEREKEAQLKKKKTEEKIVKKAVNI